MRRRAVVANGLRSIVTAPVRGARALSRMVFRTSGAARLWGLPRTGLNYASQVGNGTGSSTITAPLYWTARTFPEAPPALWKVPEDGQEEQVRRHALLRLLQRPNPYVVGPILWMATVIDRMVDGNAYWLKIRSPSGDVVQLWWAPSWTMKPMSGMDDGVEDPTAFIDYYLYSPGGVTNPIPVRVEDVVHFRFGQDPEDPRVGLAPLKSVLREVFTDDEAAAFTAAILGNMGVPGLLVSPDTDSPPPQEDVDETKAYLKDSYTGDKRGEPLVMSGRTKVEQFGFSPEQLILRELRRIPEERTTAVMGVPAIVAGLGAGLDRSTFTNMAEAREAAYEAGIIPMQKLMAEEIRFQLLTEWERNVEEDWRFGFDLTKVRVLQEDVYRVMQRMDLGVRGGWIQVGEARRAGGLPVEDADAVYLRPANATEVDARTGAVTPYAPSSSKNGNGNGAHHLDEEGIAAAVVRAMERDQLVRGGPTG